MSRFLRSSALFCLLLVFAALPILAQVAPDQAIKPVQPDSFHKVRIVPWQDANAPVGLATSPPGAHLTYFGGPVISNVQVVQVLYGSGSYNAQVAGTSTPSMGNFFSDLTGTNSGYVSLLSQYDTPASGGTGQTIGNGTFGGLFQIVPSAANSGSSIDDAQIQAELLAQIGAGHLPAPVLDAAGHVNTLYMIYFPPGVSITLQGSGSCVAGGFCAYHGTTSNTLNSKNILYGVLPDMQAGSGCSTGCGASTTFGNYTSVTSHELTESITDADVGIATTFAAPLGWYDMNNGEIGDICNAQQGSYVANGTTYTIQLEFSNAANNCVLPPAAAAGANFSVAASPASSTVTAGGSASYSVTVTGSGGFSGAVGLSVSGLPTGATASFSSTSVTGSGSSTLNVTTSSSTPAGTFTLTITGTSGSLTHTATVTLVVNNGAQANFSIAVSPASLAITRGTSGSYTVTVTGSNGFAGTVSLSVSGLPSRVTSRFNPTSVTGSGTSTLTLTVSSRATRGSRTITITGTSGSLNHSASATLTIQ